MSVLMECLPCHIIHLFHRDEIASCSEKAYDRLRIVDAQTLMMFESDAAVREYAEEVRPLAWLCCSRYLVLAWLCCS
jgi:hypothetical protein